ncbi:hypothetical protein BDA96_03G004500 [Sorghum bicolor]|uniref:Uncharacterized protein n=1 Tax=Sorghum bicolor TaxID=4558 RepID=A0A921R9P9_SORBI|nr:hypothetical protein BDA96_03G004500 [Sorghum bicolor]
MKRRSSRPRARGPRPRHINPRPRLGPTFFSEPPVAATPRPANHPLPSHPIPSHPAAATTLAPPRLQRSPIRSGGTRTPAKVTGAIALPPPLLSRFIYAARVTIPPH